MPEYRSFSQIEIDNPGFGISCRYGPDGPLYAIFYRDGEGRSCHVHCRTREQIQPLIDQLAGRRAGVPTDPNRPTCPADLHASQNATGDAI